MRCPARVALVVLLAGVSRSVGSYGDHDPFYRRCRIHCASLCAGAEGVDCARGFNASFVGLVYEAAAILPWSDQEGRLVGVGGTLPSTPPTVPLSPAEGLLGWTCAEDCGYKCMHAAVEHWRSAGSFRGVAALGPVQQYHGKWPFYRILGTQEIASTTFSVANALPHAYSLFVRPRAVFRCPPREWHYGVTWGLVWPIVSLNTWLWSAVFHARDTWLTERLDYHFATAYLVYVVFGLAIDSLPRRRPRRRQEWEQEGKGSKSGFEELGVSPVAVTVVGTAAMAFWVGHCAYLNLVRFDYGYNMTVSVVLYLVAVVLFVLPFAREGYLCNCCCTGPRPPGALEVPEAPEAAATSTAVAAAGRTVHRPRQRSHLTQGLVCLLGTALAATLELGDFPPFRGVFDAHSLWHACTPPLAWCMYSCVVGECRWRRDGPEGVAQQKKAA